MYQCSQNLRQISRGVGEAASPARSRTRLERDARRVDQPRHVVVVADEKLDWIGKRLVVDEQRGLDVAVW
jgi:hypothetical protein